MPEKLKPEENSKPPLTIIKCSFCQGLGYDQHSHACPECLGYGVYGIYSNKLLLYLGFPKDPTHISVFFKLKLYATVVFEWMLKIFTLWGPLILLYYGWLAFQSGFLFNELLFERSIITLLFWSSWLCWMFLLYWNSKGDQGVASLDKILTKAIADTSQSIPPTLPTRTTLERMPTVDFSHTFNLPLKLSFLFALLKASSEQQNQLSAWHLLYCIGQRPYFQKTLARMNINHLDFLKKIEEKIQQIPKATTVVEKVYLTPELKEACFYTLWFILQLQVPIIHSYSVLLGLIRLDFIYKVFQEYDITLEDFQNTIFWTEQMIASSQLHKFYWKQPYRRKGKHDAGWTSAFTLLLNKYSQDLTQAAATGYLLPAVGRQNEIDTLMHVLDRVTKSHALLVGEPGVGRSTIINGLAQRIASSMVPLNLQNRRVVNLNLAALFSEKLIPEGTLSVTTDSGSEQILAKIMHELAGSGEIILVLEDIQLLFSQQGQSINAFAIMRPYIENNVFKTIGITTPSAYKELLEQNETFANFFHVLKVEEPPIDVALLMVKTLAIGIERAHGVVISYPAVEAAVKLSHRYIKDKALPSKAIDLLDEAAVVTKERKQQYVTQEIVIELVTKQTGIPVQDARADEAEKLLRLEELLHQRVIGQDEAVKAVSTAMRRARSGLKQENRPIATFLFMGPTGVGKTELSKALAAAYFASEKNIIRLDMSEYQNSTDIYKLIGSPDSKTGGYLTEAVRQKPFSLLLLDELEKADSKIWDLFLQVFDDGRLTDSRGMTIDFTHTIIICTSNIGATFIQQTIAEGWNQEKVREQLIVELQKHFRPEFINRFDGVIVFKPLTQEQLYQIAHLMLGEIKKQLAQKEILLDISPHFLTMLIQKGYHPEFGARPLRRVIQEEVENVLAEKMLRGELKKNDTITL